MTAHQALRNWAGWVYHKHDVNDKSRHDSLVCAIAVDLIVRQLGWREKKAVAGKYGCELVHWKDHALQHALRIVERGLRKRKLIS